MTTKIEKPIIYSKEAPRQIIFEDYKSLNGELPILGGWGYTKEDAVIIDKNDPTASKGLPFDGVDIEYTFVEKRIYEELIVFSLLGEPHAGIGWKQLSQKLETHNERDYDILTYEVTALPKSDWYELKEDLKSGGPSGVDAYEEKRREKLISYTTEYWFDITSFFGASSKVDDKEPF
jgi:hypothetical protein